ncbi:MAG TPA: hypothetical protein VIG86_04800 [Candidatus Dormibacteraeota bacterium]|jgi:hypothetical protein
MAANAPSVLRVAGPLARAANTALRRLDAASQTGHGGDRHPLAPAALRVERARSRRSGERADQTAVTVWFGQGPSLPAPGNDTLRGAVRIGGGLLGAAALAAMTVIAARREEARTRVIDAPAPTPRRS